jgi:hypothetical protein
LRLCENKLKGKGRRECGSSGRVLANKCQDPQFEPLTEKKKTERKKKGGKGGREGGRMEKGLYKVWN